MTQITQQNAENGVASGTATGNMIKRKNISNVTTSTAGLYIATDVPFARAVSAMCISGSPYYASIRESSSGMAAIYFFGTDGAAVKNTTVSCVLLYI